MSLISPNIYKSFYRAALGISALTLVAACTSQDSNTLDAGNEVPPSKASEQPIYVPSSDPILPSGTETADVLPTGSARVDFATYKLSKLGNMNVGGITGIIVLKNECLIIKSGDPLGSDILGIALPEGTTLKRDQDSEIIFM